MANLKEVRKRITSVNTTKQITSAMKLVAASRLRKAQQYLLNFRPYAFKMKELLLSLTHDMESSEENVFLEERTSQKVLIVAIASNRGLCGAFNNNIIKAVKNQIANKYQQQQNAGNLHLITIGKSVTNFFKKRDLKILESYDEIFDELDYNKVYEIAEKIIKNYVNKDFDKVDIIYNKFKNAAVQKVTTEQFLPLMADFSAKREEIVLDNQEENQGISRATGNKVGGVGTDRNINVNMSRLHTSTKDLDFSTDHIKIKYLNNYIYEPNKKEIIELIIPKTLKVNFFRILLDSYASEHGARMTAMHQATDNATEIIKQLKIEYNKARQAAITNEIIEIVSGANALGG